MKVETMSKPIKVATMHFEADEILALMWAIEEAGAEGKESHDASERAWSVHSRLQDAWMALLEAAGKG